MFQAMLDRIEEETIRYLFLIQPIAEEELPQRRQQSLRYQQPQNAPPQRMKQARALIPKKKKRR
jgi:preprotein translocase subunit SecA